MVPLHIYAPRVQLTQDSQPHVQGAHCDSYTLSNHDDRTATVVCQARPLLIASCPSSKKEKLSTMVLRVGSVDNLFPGENSSKPTTNRHGRSGLDGCRRAAAAYSSIRAGDSPIMLVISKAGSMYSH